MRPEVLAKARGTSALVVLAGLVLVVAGCGTGAKGSSTHPTSPPSVRDNSDLTPAALRDRVASELGVAGAYRVHVIRQEAAGRTDLRIEVSGYDAYLVGTYRGYPVQAIKEEYELLIRAPRFPGLSATAQDALDRELHGRWVSFFQDDMKATGIPALMVDVRGSVAAGRQTHGVPTSGPERNVGGVPAVSYRLPNGTLVWVPRTGTPLPVLVETRNGSIAYSDFGESITIERFKPTRVIWFGDLRSRLLG